jgi:hypothetical protein
MKKLVMLALAMAGVYDLGGSTEKTNCTSNNAGNSYKCCPTGQYDADGECDD